MSYRGGGFRGRGRGWGGIQFAPQVEIVLFPDIDLPAVEDVKEEIHLANYKGRLQSFWRSSAYHLEESGPKDTKSTEIERYCDRAKRKATVNRGPLSQYLELSYNNFPRELLDLTKQGKGKGPSKKKVRWSADPGWEKFDLYELREKLLEAQGEKVKGEEEEEKEDEEEEDDGIDPEDEADQVDFDDYNQNVDFDDDEDDFNMDDGVEDEPTYD